MFSCYFLRIVRQSSESLCPVFSRKVFFRGEYYIGYANTFRYKYDVNNNSNTDHWCNLRDRERKKNKKKKKRTENMELKVTVDLQGCLPKNHSHARLLCYNHRKLYIIVKLLKFRIRRINFFLFDLTVRACKPSNAKLTLFAKLNYLPSCSHERPNKVHNVNQ